MVGRDSGGPTAVETQRGLVWSETAGYSIVYVHYSIVKYSIVQYSKV